MFENRLAAGLAVVVVIVFVLVAMFAPKVLLFALGGVGISGACFLVYFGSYLLCEAIIKIVQKGRKSSENSGRK